VTNQTVEEKLADLEIRIFQKQEQGYPVEMTLGGQQEFPRGHIAADVLPWAASGDLVADGQKLLEKLLADAPLRDAWAQSKGQALKRRVRFRLDAAAAELHALPWELLQEGQAMLAAQSDTPFSRYLPIALPWGGEVKERPIRVLVVISNPDDLQAKYELPQADVALERKALEDGLAGVGPDKISVEFMDAPVTLERLEEALRKGYHILHLLGHGAFSAKRGQAALYMQDAEGHARRVLDDEFVSMLARQGVQLRLVVLAACQSATRSSADAFLGLGPKLVSVGVPAVVAMQDFVTVETARKFSGAFYKRLLEHGQVDLAVNEARSALLTAGRPDAAVPVLFMRLKSGQLWGSEADARGTVLGEKNPRIFWSGLIRMIQQGKCTPIIGPHVHGRWLPNREEIAKSWAHQHGYPFARKDDLARVAQYMASCQGEDFPRCELLDKLMNEFESRLPEELRSTQKFKTLTEMVQSVDWKTLAADDPNEVHRVAASLNLPLYLTTNPDSFMTEALKAAGKQPSREICRWNENLDSLPSLFEDKPDYEPTAASPLVYHLLGSDEQADSLVLTEDSYLDYLVKVSAETERIPAYIWAALANSSLLFLGYSLRDWEFRVIMRGLVATREQRRKFKHVAVQLDVDDVSAGATDEVQTFLQQYFQNAEINVFWGSAQQFVAELREQWEAASK
jgi:hypothetical protein